MSGLRMQARLGQVFMCLVTCMGCHSPSGIERQSHDQGGGGSDNRRLLSHRKFDQISTIIPWHLGGLVPEPTSDTQGCKVP